MNLKCSRAVFTKSCDFSRSWREWRLALAVVVVSEGCGDNSKAFLCRYHPLPIPFLLFFSFSNPLSLLLLLINPQCTLQNCCGGKWEEKMGKKTKSQQGVDILWWNAPVRQSLSWQRSVLLFGLHTLALNTHHTGETETHTVLYCLWKEQKQMFEEVETRWTKTMKSCTRNKGVIPCFWCSFAC